MEYEFRCPSPNGFYGKSRRFSIRNMGLGFCGREYWAAGIKEKKKPLKKRKGLVAKRGKTAPRKKPIPAATGRAVASLRAGFDMSQGEFARLLGVSVPSVSSWDNSKGRLNLQTRTLEA